MKTTSKKFTLNLVIVFLGLLLIGSLSYLPSVFAGDTPTNTSLAGINSFKTYEFFASSTAPTTTVATTTSATSTNIIPYFTTSGVYDDGSFKIAGAKKVTVYFDRAYDGGNAGSTLFKVQVSPNGSDWYDYNKLISNVTNTNAQTLTRVANATISAATSTTIVSLDVLNDTFYSIRCIVVETTDGSHRCRASAEF